MNFPSLFSLFLKKSIIGIHDMNVWFEDKALECWMCNNLTAFWTQHGIDLLKALFYIQKVIVIYINFLL